ncbi:heme-binding protein [Pseudomonas sp. SWRI154]|nr:heme-binding protein [Pseudomonas sp. SWRI154]
MISTVAFAVVAASAHAQLAPLVELPSQAAAVQSVVAQKNLSYVHAMRLANVAVAVCAANNQSVAATVVDRSGTVLAMLRSDNTGPIALAGSERKAYTALSFKTETSNVMARTVQAPQLANLPGTLALTGGVPIRVGGEVIGAIGVGGAPDGRIDAQCANYAIDKYRLALIRDAGLESPSGLASDEVSQVFPAS